MLDAETNQGQQQGYGGKIHINQRKKEHGDTTSMNDFVIIPNVDITKHLGSVGLTPGMSQTL